MENRAATSLLTTLFFAIFGMQAIHAQPYPQTADVSTPEAIVQAAYEAIQRAPGQNYNWERFRLLFLPQATLIPNAEQTGSAFVVHSPEAFIALVDSFTVVGGPNDKGFAEEATHNVVNRFGDIAQVFSTYQKHFWEDDKILGRELSVGLCQRPLVDREHHLGRRDRSRAYSSSQWR